MMSLFTRATHFIILITAALLTVGIAACDGDGDETPEAPSPASDATPTVTAETDETPEQAAQPTPTEPTAPATVVQRYEPPAALPDPSSLPSADCWTSSGSTGRADAFRCRTEDSLIYDPCFLDEETMVLACPDDPRDGSTTFYARWGGDSGDPDQVRGEATGPERAWFLVLDAPDSPACRFLTGATMVLPGGARMDFDCAGPCSSPGPAGAEDLAVSCYPGTEPGWSEEEMLAVETVYTVAEAWY
jgi:hypothetical protein